MKIVVIGAGASGIIASLKIKETNEVILIDGNDKVGKKILLTGNGKCNYWNSDISLDKYYTDNYDLLNNILEKKNNTFEFLTSLGIYPKIKDGYYYPYSGQASSVREIFEKEIEKRTNIKFINNCKLIDFKKINDKYIVNTDLENIECDKIIVACGSMSYPKTGSDGSVYSILEKNNIINKVLPSLVALCGEEKYFKDWEGTRIDSKVGIYVNDKLIEEETGEVQLTNYGVSGIVIYNLSSIASRNLYLNNKVDIVLDLLPEINFYEWFNERNNSIKGKTIENLLESVFPYKLMFVLLDKCNINRNITWDSLSNDKKLELSNLTNNLKINIKSTLSYDRSQVCTGGLSMNSINNNMELINMPGVYVIGEVLDCDGKCGGFNLAFSFITGFIAGSDINDKS